MHQLDLTKNQDLEMTGQFLSRKSFRRSEVATAGIVDHDVEVLGLAQGGAKNDA